MITNIERDNLYMENELMKYGLSTNFKQRVFNGSVLFYIGAAAVAVGICIGAYLSGIQNGAHIGSFFGMDTVFGENTGFFNTFLDFFLSDLQVLLIFFAFGFTLFGFPAYLIIQIFIGFTLGFSAVVLFSSHGLYALLPVGLALIPRALIILTGISFSAKTVLPVSFKILEFFNKSDIIRAEPHMPLSNCFYAFAFSAVLTAISAILCAVVSLF